MKIPAEFKELLKVGDDAPQSIKDLDAETQKKQGMGLYEALMQDENMADIMMRMIGAELEAIREEIKSQPA